MTENQNKLIPDWNECRRILLVYPENLAAGVGSLIPFYKRLTQCIAEHSTKKISLLTTIDEENIKSKLNYNSKISFIKSEVKDVWIKDFAPLQVRCGKNIVLKKGKYDPQYLKSAKDHEFAQNGNEVGWSIGQMLKKQTSELTYQKVNLVLDGGNITANGKGTAITTNRIITDNEWIRREDLNAVFNYELGIDKLIILPVEPGDVTGHVDGMVRFLNENTVAVADYPESYEDGKTFYDKIATILIEEGLHVVRITNSTPPKEPGFPSAGGNYLNFLRIEDVIFLPKYKDQDELFNNAKEQYENFVDMVVGVESDEIAKYGGVLNCISYLDYKTPDFDFDLLPGPDADWFQIQKFALTFNGYEYSDKIAELANAANNEYHKGRYDLLQHSLDDLRGFLFYEQRRFRHFGWAPQGQDMAYIKALVAGIQDKALIEENGSVDIDPTFEFFIGGYAGDNFKVVSDGRYVIFYKSEHPYWSSLNKRVIKVSTDDWIQFESFLKTHVTRWDNDYSNNDIVGGTQWELIYRDGASTIKCGGSNSYPHEFDTFLDEVSSITGGAKIY